MTPDVNSFNLTRFDGFVRFALRAFSAFVATRTLVTVIPQTM
jgi:hypothetical protein